jgi:AbrB family looped-hinge helix DNA binding protein
MFTTMATKVSFPQVFSASIGAQTAVVNEKGQIVIPAELRKRIGIAPGTRIVFWLEGQHIALQAVEKFVEDLPASFAPGRSLGDIRERDHRRDDKER